MLIWIAHIYRQVEDSYLVDIPITHTISIIVHILVILGAITRTLHMQPFYDTIIKIMAMALINSSKYFAKFWICLCNFQLCSYATSNGIQQQESGRLKNIDTSEVHGSYSYTSPEGKQISVNYVADEYGFRPSGEHLPTPPPIPDAILRSLQYNAAHPNDDGQYRDNRYDSAFYNRNYYQQQRGYHY